MFKHFNYAEFFPHCSDSEIAEVVRSPTLSTSSFDTLMRLDALREYMNEPVIITSGYRSLKHNKRVLGSPTSHHMRATSVDIKNFADMNRFRRYINDHLKDFYQVIFYKTFTHIDFRKPGESLPFRQIIHA